MPNFPKYIPPERTPREEAEAWSKGTPDQYVWLGWVVGFLFGFGLGCLFWALFF